MCHFGGFDLLLYLVLLHVLEKEVDKLLENCCLGSQGFFQLFDVEISPRLRSLSYPIPVFKGKSEAWDALLR